MQIQTPIDADFSNSSITGVRNFGKKLINKELGGTGMVVVDVQPRGTGSNGNGIKLR